jgi:hypothetical protein
MAAMTRFAARLSGESGAELIEFALALPVMLLVGLGVLDFGLLFQRYEVVTNAAREGARVAILPGYGTGDVVARVDEYLTAGGLTGPHDPPTIIVTTVPVGLLCTAVTSVQVTYPYSFSLVGGIASYFGATGLSSTTLTATAEMRNELPGSGCS